MPRASCSSPPLFSLFGLQSSRRACPSPLRTTSISTWLPIRVSSTKSWGGAILEFTRIRECLSYFYCTGWSNWILLRKYFIWCLRYLFLYLVWLLSNSVSNTSISGVKSSWTSLYCTLQQSFDRSQCGTKSLQKVQAVTRKGRKIPSC